MKEKDNKREKEIMRVMKERERERERERAKRKKEIKGKEGERNLCQKRLKENKQ